ncbi:hypothetical protein LTR70_006484 [Exophiala xenobiotica]|uniref:Uncharacterized protein n=1 Tax=Lithohypha guttulata TaxID=1690604 RepID=A0ABR0JYC8_9EURO|nr:hypothetical protein LTR24_009098 [Lithohypha guttulata]KAK5315932.1 hypothetical protein LTR70_006484 [Exophiala xenobiotica]
MTGYIESAPKRRKLNHDQDHSGLHQAPVTRADQLHQWTEFSTDSSAKSRITAFKDHLASITRLEDVAQQSKQFRILKEYCEWQKAPSDDQVHFNDLLSTWSFAVDNNADAVISALPGALAQLLKTISGTFELQPFGLALIDSLLRRDQSKLFEKCLSAPRSRPHLASPCLRLLTEIVSFGVGARATEFWTRRDLVMYKFEAVLEQHNTDKGLEERRKPSVRRMALRLLLAMLKHLDAHAKADLLVQARTLHACLHGLPLDGDDIVVEVLRSIESSLVDDEEVPRECIISFFKSSRLDLLASLYKFEAEDDTSEARNAVREALQKLLEKLCTTNKGIVIPDHGWCPFGSTVGYVPTSENDYIDLGLDSSYYDDERKAPVANVELLAFISKLRYGDPLQSSLLLHALRAAPELVAEYFSRPQTQRIAPPNSEDEAWRAHFAFLFSVIESEVSSTPAIAEEPPQPRFAIESIVPKPIDRGYVNKLLSSKDEILKVSGARLLTVVLKKLSQVLDAFAHPSSASDQSYMWQQARSKLLELVESRMPTARDISLALQHVSRDEPSYSALLECLHRYYKALPHMAAASTFDVGPILLEVCSSLETTDLIDGAAALLDQLSYCVEIANMASSTKWLHKPDNETLSPLGRVLKVAMVQAPEDEAKDILRVVRQVLTRRGILVPGEPAFAALCSSLSKHKKFSPSEELYLFVDNCIARTNQKPVKYLDDLEHASQLVSDKKPLSLIVGAVAEQWAFVCKKYEESKFVLKNIATWIARLFALLDSAGENYRIMMHLQDNMLSGSVSKSKEYLQDASDKLRRKPAIIEEEWQLRKPATIKDADQDVDMGDVGAPTLDATDTLLVENVPIPDSLEGLDKWPADFDIELEVDTNRLRRVLLCVSSPDEEIRLQTQQILHQITYTVDTTSTHTLKHQVYLVLGEVCETLIQQRTSQPQPTIIPELADTLIRIMTHPTHSLYAKANKFLLHKPSWPAKHVTLYWLEKVLHRDPDDPDAWTAETEWLLQLFLRGLRTQIDLDLYRRTGLWEKVLSLYSSPVLTQPNKQLILALLRVACSISGGVDMLWTRFGVHSWLRMKEATDKENEKVLRGLREKMEKECSLVIERWEIACPLTKKLAPAQ